MDKLRVCFPHMGDYHLPIGRFFKEILPEAEVFPAPAITQRTVELGARHSPDFVCSPFKYNMGNFIEALEMGANLLLQTGTGCRYGFYGEVQERLLRDLGYSFQFICLSREKAGIRKAYDICKSLNPRLSFPSFLYHLAQTVERVRVMDRLDYMLRQRVGFEKRPGDFERAKRELLHALEESETIGELEGLYRKYRRRYESIELDLPRNVLRVGIVGELYTLMEPFSNHYLERQLAKAGIVVSRQMSVSFLLFGKRDSLSLKTSKSYLRHAVGANGLDSVSQCIKYARRGYDGILHIKSFGCAPELNAQPALINISRDMDIPIMHLSFDTHTGRTGLETRIEAFIDMIKMKRERSYEAGSLPRRGRGLHFHQGRFD